MKNTLEKADDPVNGMTDTGEDYVVTITSSYA